MNIKPVLPVSGGSFIYDLRNLGAVCLRVLASKEAERLAAVVRGYRFTERTGQYGPRGVVQRFSACEEEDIPMDSAVRDLSRKFSSLVGEMLAERADDEHFKTPPCFNDHLILLYPPSDVGLGAHKDHSKYVNLIVSLTLSGESRFNLHDDPENSPSTTFRVTPGMAVFMRAPGFLGEDIRPYHSVTGVSQERISLILKQKER